MQKQKRHVEVFVHKNMLRQKTIIHCPLVHENTTQIEGTFHVGIRVSHQKWKTHQ